MHPWGGDIQERLTFPAFSCPVSSTDTLPHKKGLPEFPRTFHLLIHKMGCDLTEDERTTSKLKITTKFKLYGSNLEKQLCATVLGNMLVVRFSLGETQKLMSCDSNC